MDSQALENKGMIPTTSTHTTQSDIRDFAYPLPTKLENPSSKPKRSLIALRIFSKECCDRPAQNGDEDPAPRRHLGFLERAKEKLGHKFSKCLKDSPVEAHNRLGFTLKKVSKIGNGNSSVSTQDGQNFGFTARKLSTVRNDDVLPTVQGAASPSDFTDIPPVPEIHQGNIQRRRELRRVGGISQLRAALENVAVMSVVMEDPSVFTDNPSVMEPNQGELQRRRTVRRVRGRSRLRAVASEEKEEEEDAAGPGIFTDDTPLRGDSQGGLQRKGALRHVRGRTPFRSGAIRRSRERRRVQASEPVLDSASANGSVFGDVEEEDEEWQIARLEWRLRGRFGGEFEPSRALLRDKDEDEEEFLRRDLLDRDTLVRARKWLGGAQRSVRRTGRLVGGLTRGVSLRAGSSM